MRVLLASPLLILAQPLCAQPLTLSPIFGTELRYEQYAPDRLLGGDDAILFRARPGIALEAGPWSFDAISDAAIAMRRDAPGIGSNGAATRPDAFQLGELKLQYRGLPATAISVGRQHLGIADVAITGDRDGEQTFDAARLRWTGLPGLSADLAYAWSSSSLWAANVGALPVTVPGENIFAQLSWTSGIGTFSGYAYQIDQRNAASDDFRLLNQVYGARFTGTRKVGEAVKVGYSLGYVRQTGAMANAAGGAPTYWQMGSDFDLGDLSGTRTSYRRFAANGISTLNGDKLTVATSASRGPLTVGATYSDFRPIADTRAISTRDVRVSLGLVF